MKILLLIGCLLITFSSFAQPEKIKELQTQLSNASTPEAEVDILCDLSYQYFYSNSKKALEYSQKALKLAQQHNYRQGIASAYNCIAIVHMLTGDTDKASTFHYRALNIREAIGDSFGMSQSYNNLAILLRERKKHNAASELQIKSLRISEAMQDSFGMEASHHNLGGIYLDQKIFDKSLYHFKEAIRLKELLKDEKSQAGSLNAIGVIYKYQEDFDKAIAYHTRALQLATKADSPLDQFYSFDGLSKAYYKKGSLDKALTYSLQSYEVVKDRTALVELNSAAQTLSKLYEETGDKGNALEYLKLHMQYKDSLYNADMDAKVEELQLTYRNEKAEQENKLLKAERDLKNQQLERNSTIQFFIAALLLMASAAAFFFFKGKERLSSVNKQLTENGRVLSRQKEELTQQAALLQEQKQELEKLHTVKDRLFSVIAHDLRGPLASLQDLLKLFAAGVIPESKFNIFMGKLEVSQQNALWLLDNLLVWARSQMQGFSLAKEEINIYALAEENILLLSPQAQQKGVILRNEITADVLALADRETIKLVFRNLISNAIKFCSEGQDITLAAEARESMLYISVTDTGTGIKPEHLGKLFGSSNFTTKGTAKEKGSGLGLSLCKDFVEQNGGTIGVESEYGKGSTFFFTLPLPHVETKLKSVPQTAAATLQG